MQKVRTLYLHQHPEQIKFTNHFRNLYSTRNSSSTIDFNRHLNDLSKGGNIDDARHLFDKMPHRDEFSWNIMLAAYANSGRLMEANQLFHQAPLKSSITWSSLISGYCKHGCEIEAFELYRKMKFEGYRPNQYTLGSLLRLCSRTGLIRRGEQIHGYAIKIKLDCNDFVATSLIDMYAKCEYILEAECVFEMVRDKKNHATWTAMLGGYSHNGDGLKAMEFFRDLRIAGVEANQFTFPSILTVCGGVSALYFGIQVHNCVILCGFGANIFVQSSLVDMYAKCGSLDSAKRVLREMDVDDVISWNSIIVGCARLGFQEEALSLFHQMHMRGMKVDEYSYPSVLNCFAGMKDVENAKSIHSLIVKAGFAAYKLVNNALVDMYAKQGELDCAFMVFKQMPEKDVISWTSLITGCSYNGSHEEAVKLFCNMRNVGVFLDQIALASVLSACAELTVMEFGQQVHAIIVKSGLGSSLSVDNSLLTMYAKCGSIEDASCVFDSMRTRDVISWTALIVGFAQNGRGKDSLRFYDRMIVTGIKPDFITFIGLLFACSHTGLVEDGRRYFESMDKEYGIKPGPQHYACMIDLFGRSGKLAEAKELLKQMVVEPDATVWKSLLAACRTHRELELGEIAANNLFELEPNNSMPYILLSNMYSVAGRWEDAARIRRSMKAKGISKEPGYSWTEWNSKVHVFMSEDRNHPMMNEIYSNIDEIIRLIKEAGYVADMNFALHDMDREGKELGLAYHSEKLAISFGLLTVPKGAPIRIFKNLRVCGDCHTAMKYISKVYLRHIILRDSNCFHHFRNGECSCRDYW
ncbi:pentatricopeptide repeat-containing protein At4g21065 [Euphorbia lathyris]|uniref:pentatricopeptide repeat-containing protein At4g21065 n=1 Tax=Euphorbia lathyris TaxID=212925 RepID=UPI003313D138